MKSLRLRLVFSFLCSLLAAPVLHAQPYTINTLAGLAGSKGSADGTGSEARFNNPIAVAVDKTGIVYVADTGNNTIRKITPGGVVTTFAGSVSGGSADGQGGAAAFFSPEGLAVDAAGNLYVSDMGNDTIRKITPGGLVSTIAGKALQPGSADGNGGNARFHHPYGIAVDKAGTLYVSDFHNYTIRKISPAGEVTTLAGLAETYGFADGLGSAARFSDARGITLDSQGNLWVAEDIYCVIRKIRPDGMVTTPLGTPFKSGSIDAVGAEARFYHPGGVAADLWGNLFVADGDNATIRKITPNLMVTTVAGLPGTWGSADGTGTDARFFAPDGIAVDSAGVFYVVEAYNHTVRRGQLGAITPPLIGMSRMNNQLILSWPLAASNSVLEGSSSLCPGATWTQLTNDNGISGDTLVHTNSLDAPAQFFRLRTP
jgi:sugar lactone lactonase YvrE